MGAINRFRMTAFGETMAAGILVSVLLGSGLANALDGPLRGQEVMFFQSPVSVSGEGQWSLTIQGRVYKRAETSIRLRALIDVLAPAVGARPKDQPYRERAGSFLSESIRDVQVSVKLGERIIALPPSDHGGYFSADIPLTDGEVGALARDGVVSFESQPTATNPKRYKGNAVLMPAEGVIVVTDMDDTIKVTEILHAKEKIANTFLRKFKAVPGMPELYGAWKAAPGTDMRFHVVSAGPWQFHEPLRQFTEQAGFPAFTWDMRSVDIGDISVLLAEVTQNLDNIEDHKVRKIRALMQRFPKRHVVLVGDSGERDPEAYAKITAEFIDRVDAVYIRNVQREDQAARYTERFHTPEMKAKLTVFLEPKDLPPLGARRVEPATPTTREAIKQ